MENKLSKKGYTVNMEEVWRKLGWALDMEILDARKVLASNKLSDTIEQ